MAVTNRQLTVFAKIDSALDKLSPLDTFLSKEEYQAVYDNSKDWISRERFLKSLFYKALGFHKNDLVINFPLQLQVPTDTHNLLEVFAVVPIEYQLLSREGQGDILLVRLYLGSKNYRVSWLEITPELKETIEKGVDASQIEAAYFKYVHQYAKKMLGENTMGVSNWDEFQNQLAKRDVDISEYTGTGLYLWRLDYQLFDNREIVNGTKVTLIDQLQAQKNMELEEVEVLTASANKKSKKSPQSSLFKDEYGNLWNNEKAYLKYKNLLNLLK